MANTDLAVIAPLSGVDTYRTSTDAATVCRDIVKATAQSIQGKKYVRVEGWNAIAVAHGCVASARDVEKVEGGLRAIGEIRRMSDGAIIATAEGFVGDDEHMWQKRPMFARRAMAQTRAISRVCRSAFAHVVILIDKELGTTPAEEMMAALDHEPDNVANAATRSLTVDPADRGMVKGDGGSKYQDDKAKRAAKWADNFIGTVKLSGQTKESLDELWEAEAKWLGKLEEYHPALHEKVEAAFIDARDAAVATPRAT